MNVQGEQETIKQGHPNPGSNFQSANFWENLLKVVYDTFAKGSRPPSNLWQFYNSKLFSLEITNLAIAGLVSETT